MKKSATNVRLSASDLSNHLSCRHLTVLDLEVAAGERPVPSWSSPDAQILRERGIAHENAYVEHLRASGLSVVNLTDFDSEQSAVARTILAVESGVDVIVQATFSDGNWFGRADVLRKVERASKLGDWSYEAYDCKLARETKAATILQLSLYSHLLEGVQGVLPEFLFVVPPGEAFEPETYRVLDYAAYYRYVKSRLQTAVIEDNGGIDTYPEPTPHCEVCKWREECDRERRKDDHLSLVAGISRLQRKQLVTWDTDTVAALAGFPIPIPHRPDHGSRESYVRVREQARVQVAGRESGRPVHEVLGVTEEHGLNLLPEPSPGDIFFDLEGDPFVGISGREYLFGVVLADADPTRYEYRWALNAADEKDAFIWFVDLVMARWAEYSSMHIYHFAPYEPSAVKRLMGRYGVREDEIDRMLRAKLFIDLHTVVKRSVRASVEQYSLKTLEAFHGFARRIPLVEAGQAMRVMQHALEGERTPRVGDAVKQAIVLYNGDDCFSTRSLRDWLERERLQLENAGHHLMRPVPSDGAPAEAVSENQQRSAALAAALKRNIPLEPELRSPDQAASWLTADLLDWHRREAKADWWEYFRIKDLTDEDLLDERSAIAGLSFQSTLEVVRKVPTDRYSFDKQETDVRTGDTVCQRGEKIGEVVAIDVVARTIDIKKTKKTANVHPSAVFVDKTGPNTDVLADALFRLGEWIEFNGVDAAGPYRAARDLLLRRPPRLAGGGSALLQAGESTVDAAKRIAGLLDNSVLAVQGPPGAGKTHAGARMMCELIKQGKKVGITAASHKVIRNLLDKVVEAAAECGIAGLQCIQKVTDKSEENTPSIIFATNNAEPLAALRSGAQVVAGTAWLWARKDYFEAVDVLFVDEAGQMSLANVLAVAQGAKSVVLLGDPQQLDQPQKGSHPDGAEVSALEHLLDGARTIPPDKGLFLEQTWRLHPAICKFTSEVFYEGRLTSRDGLERQSVTGHPWLSSCNLWFVAVEHEGNQNSSSEEVQCIATLVESLLRPGVNWVNAKGQARALQAHDILIVAPYNAQVSDLAAQIPRARIGTVDKFQGQQAPVVIYSLTTSSPEDAPRGMEFLYSLNRLNVATSRAQAMVIIVGSPRLLEPECHSPRQMQLANAICRYVELAQVVSEAAPLL
ncbi:MAG TPA: TM0106 family RecB-like putative nuclease [Terracidiphilus sp.]